jgi:RimJ/RimL family protein N-acetyltransferase
MTGCSSCLLDITLVTTDAVVGTTGFREVNLEAGTAEWGCIVAAPHQRQGYCAESFAANVAYLAETLPTVHTITACTLANNTPMLAFFAKTGLTQARVHLSDAGVEWLVFEGQVAELDGAR